MGEGNRKLDGFSMADAPSIVRGVAFGLAKQGMDDARVLGFRGKAISSPAVGVTRVCKASRSSDLDELQNKLVAKHDIVNKTKPIIDNPSLNPAEKALKVADATREFYLEFVQLAEQQRLLYPEGGGAVLENSLSQMLFVPPKPPAENGDGQEVVPEQAPVAETQTS